MMVLLLAGCGPKKPVTRTGVEIDVPIPCLTQPVRMLGCDPKTLQCQKVVVVHHKDCEEIKVNQ